jgi:hypothetical protein
MQLAQDLDNSLRPDKAIHTTALVNVIGNDTEERGRIFHLPTTAGQ